MFADIDGNTIHYVSEGEGPPVVFVHGLGGTANVWHGVIQAMKQHHHCIAMDLRGHGRSQAKGKFSIHGVEKDIEIPGVVFVEEGRSKVQTDFTIRLEDYNIEAPSLAAFVKVNEEVAVHATVHMKHKK